MTVAVFSVNACASTSFTATVAEVSSESPHGMPRAAVNTINGSGMKGDICAQGEDGMAWTTFGNLSTTDYGPFITYHLGGLYNLDAMRIWNYNSAFMIGDRNISVIGPDKVDVFISINGINFTRAETVRFSLAPGTNEYKGQAIKVNYKGVRYIRFNIKTNHDGAIFDGSGRKGGIDGRSLTGLSEVRFEGTRTDGPATDPEPANEAEGVELNTDLSWRVGDGPFKKKIKKYDLVVGIGNPANNEILHSDTLPKKWSDRASYKFPANLLTPGRKYWWRVDEIAGKTTIKGDVWTFKTRKENAAERNARSTHAKDFLDAKYGAFISWDMSSLIGGQISWARGTYGNEKYDQLYKQFEASEFDAGEWARIIARSGLKYITIVAKHHAGFCMWDTKTTDYNIMNTPFGRDWLAEFAPALRKEGVKVGLYWSIMDWYQPSYSSAAGADLTEFNTKIQYPQLKELLTNYGDIFCLWVDGQWDKSWTQAQGRELYNFCRKLQPNMVINNRVGPMPAVAGPIGSVPGSFSDEDDKIGDYLSPERKMGTFYTEYPWEACLPLDKENKWSWMPPFDNRSKKELLGWLIEAAGGGGNLLMSITPDADGRIDPYHGERFLEIGDWLYLHGDHFFDTRPGPYKPGPWGVSLHKDNKVYLYITDWSSAVSDTISLPKLPAKVVSYKLLSGTIDKVEPEVKSLIVKHGDKLEITVLPRARRDFTIVEIVLDKDAGDIEYIDTGKRKLRKDHTTPPDGESNV